MTLRLRALMLTLLLALTLSWAQTAPAAGEVAAGTMSSMQGLPDFCWYDGLWPHERSDISPDPSVTFGRLDNGMRYAIIPNALPPGRVTMHLAVQAGSLMEEASERGYAHLLEHMAFNGSRHFGPGGLIPFFNQHGMSFGGDTNAHTSQKETVYKLNLPASNPKELARGLEVLRDFADGMTLAPSEVDNEKGIILEEKRSRDNETVLAGREWRRRLYGDTPLAWDAIGLVSTVQNATSEALRNFYTKWYRADRMILVAVGDVKAEELEPLIREAFEDMAKPETPLPYPVIPLPQRDGPCFMAQKRPVDFTSINVYTMHPRAYQQDCKQNEELAYIDGVASLCLQNRLIQRTQAENAPWTRAFFRSRWRSGFSPFVMLGCMSAPDGWIDAMKALQEEYASAREYGFSQAEVDKAVTQLGRQLKRAVADRKQVRNDDLCAEFIGRLNGDEVFITPQHSMERLEEIRPAITVASVNQAIRDAFDGEIAINVSGGQDTSDQQVYDLWSRMSRRKAVQPENVKTAALPYLPLPAEPAELPALTQSEAPMPEGSLSIYQATMPGGVAVTMAPMPELDAGQVRVSLLFGDGCSVMDRASLGITKLAAQVVSYAGPGRLTLQERADQLGARGIDIAEGTGDYMRTINGQATKDDLGLLIMALWTQYNDPLPEDQAKLRYDKVQEGLTRSRAGRFDTVEGQSKALRFPYYMGEDFLPLDSDKAALVTLDQVKAEVAASRTHGIREIVVSGDFDCQEALAQLTRFFGEVKAGEPVEKSPNARTCVFPTEPEKTIFVEKEQVNKAVVRLAWRADIDASDRHGLAVRSLLASVIKDHMRELIREKMGAAYSPFGVFRSMETYGGFGFFLVEAATSRERAAETADALLSVVSDCAANGVSQEDLDRMRKPLMTGWKTGTTDGARIGQRLLSERLSGLPQMQWNAEFGKELASVTVEEVSAVAAKILSQAPAKLLIEGGPLASEKEAADEPKAGGEDSKASAEAR